LSELIRSFTESSKDEIFGLVVLSAFALSLWMIFHKSVVSQFAIVWTIAGLRLVLLVWWTRAFSFLNTVASLDASADLVFLLVLLLATLARGFLELLQLSLALGTQSGQALLFGVTPGLELGALFLVGRATAVEQGTLTVADGLLLGAAVQGLVLALVIKTSVLSLTRLVMLSILWWEGETRDGLLDASLELLLHGFAEGLSAFTTFGPVSVMLATSSALFASVAFSTLGCWWSASVAGVTSINFGFHGFEFGLLLFFSFLVAFVHARVEVLELGGTVLSY